MTETPDLTLDSALNAAGTVSKRLTREMAIFPLEALMARKPDYDTSTGEGQKRLMAEAVGHTYLPPRPITRYSNADYGTNPAPDHPGMVRMHPSGDLVTVAEAQRRLGR